MKTAMSLIAFLSFVSVASAQTPELKFIADTLVVQADGTYEADPDLATMTFHIFAQEKELKKAYDEASQSMARVASLGSTNGLKKEDISSGVLTVAPSYEGDRKKRARSYSVNGEIILKVHDFSHIGPILDASVQDGITDFRSLTYSLSDEEAAKKQAVAEAMRRAIGRATIALEQKSQKLGGLRYMTVDVKQLLGVAQLSNFETALEISAEAGGGLFAHKKVALPPPPPRPVPEKITVTASVQCAFQIQ